MGFVKAASKRDLDSGSKVGVQADGKEILIVNLGGSYFAIGDRCTHMGCLLSSGKLSGENVTCICHGSTFNVKTGNVVKGPAKKAEPVFEVKIEGEDILINVQSGVST